MLIGRSPSRIGSGLRPEMLRVDYRESAESYYIVEVFQSTLEIRIDACHYPQWG
jgi:hypothetical protein